MRKPEINDKILIKWGSGYFSTTPFIKNQQ